MLTKIEDLFKSWKTHAEKKQLDIFQVNHVKSSLFLAFEQLKNCTTNNSANKLRSFLDSNSHIIIAGSDKTKNLNILFTEDYIKKLDKVFDKDHFLKLKSNPINVDLSNFRKLLNQMKPYMTNKDEYHASPCENLKRAFGIPKNHKEGQPLRPIISSINSITSGAEQYLQQIIKLIVKKCKYSVESTKEFKSKLIKFENFDDTVYEIVSFDATSLFTSINIPKVIDYILDTIYENTEIYFPPKSIKIGDELIDMT